MSFGGHVSDMNSRMKENRALLNARREKVRVMQEKMRKVHSKKDQNMLANDMRIEKTIKEASDEIREKVSVEQNRDQVIFYVLAFSIVVLLIVGYLIMR